MSRLTWAYLPEWAAWWLLQPVDSLTAQRGYGPFNATEAVWAGEVHGVPFAGTNPPEAAPEAAQERDSIPANHARARANAGY